MVALWPGWMITGVPPVPAGSTEKSNGSPEDDVTVLSKPLVRKAAVNVPVPGGAPDGPNGPISCRAPNQMPLLTVPCRSPTVATDVVAPFCDRLRSPKRSKPAAEPCISTCAGTLDDAATVSRLVSGGTM